jgi:DNA-binding LytR/AlgR family response regulator
LNTKITCLLLDDELPGLSYLKLLCEQIEGVEVLKAFNSPEDFLQHWEKYNANFCILDIEMPDYNGLEIAKSLKNTPVIFTTAHTQYAIDAFEINAIDFVRKPVSPSRLEQAIEKVRNVVIQNSNTSIEKTISLQTSIGIVRIKVSEIMYIQTSNIDPRDKTILLNTGKTLMVKNINFENILNLLPSHLFCRINKREAINIKEVFAYTQEKISIRFNQSNQIELLNLSNSYKKEFLEKLNK